jgi:hypothetical protein
MSVNPPSNPQPNTSSRATNFARKLAAMLVAVVAATTVVAVGPASATATISITAAGDLVINGTSARDNVLILDEGDRITIEARSGSSLLTRRISTEELRRDVVVNLLGGGGYVGVIQVDVPRDLRINMGSGWNQVVHEGVEVGRNVTVIDGNGEIDISISQTTVLGRANFSTGAGHTFYEFQDNYWAGNFTFRIANSGRIVGEFRDDQFKRPFRLTGGNDEDRIYVAGFDTQFQTTSIDLRGGSDKIDIDDAASFGRATIRTGSGNDTIQMSGATMRTTYLIDMGSGDDIGFMSGVRSQGRATVNGGAGNADLLGVEYPYGGPITVRGVEGGYGY